MHDKNLTTEKNAPSSRAILMAMTMCRCDDKRIARCSMSRATLDLEATGRHQWASIRPILLRRTPWSSIFGLKNRVVALCNRFPKLAFMSHETDPLLSSLKQQAA